MGSPKISSQRFDWKSNFVVCKGAAFAIAEYDHASPNFPDMRTDKSKKPLAWFAANPDDGECFMHISRNLNLPVDQIAVKDYSENMGALDCMKKLGIIHDRALRYVRSGWVEIPVHLLTEKGMGIVVELGFA